MDPIDSLGLVLLEVITKNVFLFKRTAIERSLQASMLFCT